MYGKWNGKTALIIGVTGQDGAYLGELPLDKGYMVHGAQTPLVLVRRRT